MAWTPFFDDRDPDPDWTRDVVMRHYALIAATKHVHKPDDTMNDRRVTARRITDWLIDRNGDREIRLRALAAASVAQKPGEHVSVEDLLYDAKVAEKFLATGG